MHRSLGVLVRTGVALGARYRESARIHQAEKLGFPAFGILRDDRIVVSAPMVEPELAVRSLDRFIEDAS